jgi:hypothetical protein
VLRLPPQNVRFLQSMADDMIAVLGGGAGRYVWLRQTDVEHAYGAPHRA